MNEKKYKEVIFEWVDSGGEHHYERRIVIDKEKRCFKMAKKRFTHKEDDWEILDNKKHFAFAHSGYQAEKICELLNDFHKENQLLKEEKELLKNKLDRIEDILPHYLSCAEISEFHSKTHKEDIALMKCWNKRYKK